MAANHWSENYIGRSYAEANCAQLAVQVQREVYDRIIQLPEPAKGLRAQTQQINDMQHVVAEPVVEPIDGDAIVMHCRGSLSHVGVFCLINNQRWVLHAMKNAGHAVLHRVCDLPSVGLGIEGYYRWR